MFRIYHVKTHVTSICSNQEKFFTGVQDQNLLFTFLTNDYEVKLRQIVFSELVRIGHGQHLPPMFFFEYLLLLYARDHNKSRLTCDAILSLAYSGARRA